MNKKPLLGKMYYHGGGVYDLYSSLPPGGKRDVLPSLWFIHLYLHSMILTVIGCLAFS